MSDQTLWMYPAIFYHGKHPLDPHSAAFCQLRMDGFASHAAATGEFWKWQIAGSAEIIDIGISATEIDTEFNINSLTGSNGLIMGAIGGAPDTAAGAKLTVVVAPTMRKRIPIVTDKVTNVITPGETIDVLVTERGICVNPRRPDLIEALTNAGIELKDIKDLKEEVEKMTGTPEKTEYQDQIVAVVEYRDGTVIDVIKQVK